MSSLAATQADGYYVPPAYIDNTKPGRKPPSKNQIAQSKGHNQFLQHGVVRFELPYSGLCQQCNHYIGRGTRFNAQKKESGKYLSSTIWQFEMSCRNCQTQTFLIQTNPQEYGFDYVQGITKLEHKKELSNYNDATKSTSLSVMDISSTAAVAAVSISSSSSELDRLERVAHGQRTVMSEYDQLQALQTWNAKTYLHDADVNAHIRSKFRTERRAHQQRVAQAQQKGWIKPGMQLLDEDSTMVQEAQLIRFGPNTTTTSTTGQQQQQQQQQRDKYRQLQTSSIFDKTTTTTNRRMKKRRKRSGSSTASLITTPDAPISNRVVPEHSILSQQQHPSTKRKRVVVVKTSFANAPQATLAPPTTLHQQDQSQGNNVSSVTGPIAVSNHQSSSPVPHNNTYKNEQQAPVQQRLVSLVADYASSSDED
jgi:coiled-coil domain-containing protein 130